MFANTAIYEDMLNLTMDDADYDHKLEEIETELVDNLKIVLDNDRFQKYVVDITGGYDSRLVLALINKVDTNKQITVNTSGSDNEIRCASAVAEALGYEYDSDYMAYRRISGGYELPCNGSLSVKEYVELISSIDMGTFASSFMPACSYDENVLHLTGWCGEILRPFIAKRILKFGISDLDNPKSLTERFIKSRSGVAIADYNCVGVNFYNDFVSSISDGWSVNKHVSIEKPYINYRSRFHFDFSKECSFSTPGWAPLLSKKGFILNMKTLDRFDYSEFPHDLLHRINPEIAVYEYSDILPNLERIILLKKQLTDLKNDENIIKGKDAFTEDYIKKVEISKKEIIVMNDSVIDDYSLPHSDLFDYVINRAIAIFNYMDSRGLLQGCNIGIYNHLNKINNSRNWKALIPLYKKLNSAMTVLSIFNEECDIEECEFKKYTPLVCRSYKSMAPEN